MNECLICASKTPRIPITKVSFTPGTEFDLCECLNCGILYFQPLPDKRQIIEFYEHESYNFNRWHLEEKAKHFLKKLIKITPKGKLLDIGCATGYLINKIKMDSDWQVFGVEINNTAADFAQKELGLTVFNGELEHANYPDQTFDAIHIGDVLEHVTDPVQFMSECHRIIKQDGSLFISIPNGYNDSRPLIQYYRKTRQPGRHASGHIFFFPKKALEILLSRTGFCINDAKTVNIKNGLRNLGYIPKRFNWMTSYHPLEIQHTQKQSIPLLKKKPYPDFYYAYRYIMKNWLRIPGIHDFGLDLRIELQACNEKQKNRSFQREFTEIKSICLICTGLIGDVLFRVPLLEALKKHYPDASIIAIVDPPSKAILENHPDCDEVIVFNRNKDHLVQYLKAATKTLYMLRKRKLDLTIDLYAGGSSALMTKLINAKIRLGFDRTEKLRKSNNLLVKHPSFKNHWSKALGKILQPLGIQNDEIRRGSSFFCTEKAIQCANNILSDNQNQYILINLGAGSILKQWPVQNFVELTQLIEQEYQYKPVVLTNPGMEHLTAEFCVGYKDSERLIHLPVLDLDSIGAIIKKCAVVITGDTSIMHLSFAVKTPTVILFTDTRPEHVEPEDCEFISCFIENPDSIDAYGRPKGTKDMPVDYVYNKFKTLNEHIRSKNIA